MVNGGKYSAKKSGVAVQRPAQIGMESRIIELLCSAPISVFLQQ